MAGTFRIMMKRIITATLFSIACMASWGQIEVSQDYTIEQYVNDILLGTGVEAVNITYQGSEIQIGYLTGAEGTNFPISQGLILSSEHARNSEIAFPDEFIPFGEGVSGDADLLTIANSVPPLIGQNFNVGSVNDLCILEFDFIATGDTVSFNYSFGSDEYLEWVNSSYNDIFGFFLSGPGIVGPYGSPAGFPDGSVNIAGVPLADPPLPMQAAEAMTFAMTTRGRICPPRSAMACMTSLSDTYRPQRAMQQFHSHRFEIYEQLQALARRVAENA